MDLLVGDVAAFLEALASPSLAEDWDNVGLLVGDASRTVSAVMTCLTLTRDVAEEAVGRGAGLIVTHHPVLFRPVQRLTADTDDGRVLLALIEAGVAVYSPHTSYDSARAGINQQLAETLGLTHIASLRNPDALRRGLAEGAGAAAAAVPASTAAGAGRRGELPADFSLGDFNSRVKARLGLRNLQYVGEASDVVRRVGIACGSAADFLPDALQHGCQVLVTGEARFHACIEARACGVALVLIGHYASERPAMERLAEQLAAQFEDLDVWASERESDPLKWD